MNTLRIGLVSVSDRASSGVYQDKGIPALEEWLAQSPDHAAAFTEAEGLLAALDDDRGALDAALTRAVTGVETAFGPTAPQLIPALLVQARMRYVQGRHDEALAVANGKRVQAIKPIQGALDPLLLRAGGPALDRRVEQLLDQWGGGPYIFNLGHGILPDTPIAHVEQVLKRVTGQ